MKESVGKRFIYLAILALLGGMFFGCVGALQYILPDFLKESFPFYKIRPLHVSLIVAWIFLASVGSIYHALPKLLNKPLYSNKLAIWHYWIFLITGIIIIISYLFGYFGGREYWAFSPILALPILLSWLLLIINFFATVKDYKVGLCAEKNGTSKMLWPVYIWMWATGIVFFFLTFSEAYLWLIPYFRESIVGELTVQWKSYGSLVGSWNMLVYGLAIYVMEKTSDTRISCRPITYILFFLGFINLLLGWSHHIYILPAAKWIRLLGYAISMTELIVLAKIIWDWKGLIKQGKKHIHSIPYRFLLSADFWIITNLILAIIISIPSMNIYTHGTHITVAHAMGSTIGINTMILIAAIFYIVSENRIEDYNQGEKKLIFRGFWLTNISLAIFFSTLVVSGILKSYYTLQNESFQQMMSSLHSYFIIFAVSGVMLFVGILMIAIPLLSKLLANRLAQNEQ